MKKLLTTFIALSLLASIFIPTFATENEERHFPAPETKEEKIIFERYGEEVYYEYGYGALSQLDENGNYPVNSHGMTYGPQKLASLLGKYPDLVATIGENDILGYTLDVGGITLKEGETQRELPLFSSEMEVIDIFVTTDGSDKQIKIGRQTLPFANIEEMTVEEARNYILNYGRATEPATAIPTEISAWETEFNGYEIDGEQYVKLRDLVSALAETEYAMKLKWKSSEDKIYLERGSSEETEMTSYAVEGERIANPSYTDLLLDNGEMYLSMYNIDGSNYVDLNEFNHYLLSE